MITPGSLLLGKYRIGERLGEGGMGTVFRARDELLDREVAIKLLRTELAGDAALAERFRGEAVALARLAHPSIAALHGLERDGNHLYMVMEFVRGETLEARIQREGPLGWREAATICAAVCTALEHAHAQGVVHRDIKPANLMLGPDGNIKVMDFGIARMAGQSRHTRMGSTVGTPHYMAPEQLRGEEVDGRADLYSLGAVLFELISGKVPFEADSDYQLMMKQLHDPPPRLSDSVPGVPVSVDRLIRRSLSKDRSDRHASAAELRSALSVAAGSPEPSRPLRSREDPPLHLDWRTWAAGAMVLTSLLVLLIGNDQQPDPVDPAPAPQPVAPANGNSATPSTPVTGSGSLPVRSTSTLPIPPVPAPQPPPA
ncbi:MAG TPA: serine/threonine-protein kinase, partial [Gemmatimonadales bacterium]|nr:serine/threonine-protein kinase [Gemmatimonadales bacterium]